MNLVIVYGICLFVGFLTGGTGMGGVLIPPALVFLSGLDTHTAMGTTLASFAFYTPVGCWLFHRLGHINWRRAVPFALGGALSAGLTALFNVHVHATFLNVLLALLVLFAAVSAFRPPRARNAAPSRWFRWPGLLFIGASTGMMAGLTGTGGPLLSIAWMVAAGMPPPAAVGLSMPYSLATVITATASNWVNGTLDVPMAVHVGLLELGGFLLGIIMISRIPMGWVRRGMAVTCGGLGLFLLVRSLWPG